MHEAVVVRVATFRTTRPAFDAALRGSILPAIRRRVGVMGVFAGRQGPEEVGVRLLASVWSSREAAEGTADSDRLGGIAHEPLAETADQHVKVLPVLYQYVARPPLTTGILRVSRGRLASTDVVSYSAALSGYLAAMSTDDAGPADVVLADDGGDAFVMLSTWRDWSAIEAATGASISEPLGTKRLAELSDFVVDHFELLTDLDPAPD